MLPYLVVLPLKSTFQDLSISPHMVLSHVLLNASAGSFKSLLLSFLVFPSFYFPRTHYFRLSNYILTSATYKNMGLL